MLQNGLLLLTGLLCTHLMAAKEPQLTVQGTAMLAKPADQLIFSVAVTTESENVETALNSNNIKMQSIIAALQAEELTSKEYSTGQFTLMPVYAPAPKEVPADWIQKIIAYRVTNALSIQTDKLERVGIMIDAATQAGANAIDQISFGLKDARLHRQEAIKTATNYALQDAKDLAESANVRLGAICQIGLDPDQQLHLKAMSLNSFNSSAPLEPADVIVSAHVTIIFELLAAP